MRALGDKCYEQTGITNVFNDGAKRYLWEVSSTEHRDGAITGKVLRYVSETHVMPAGSFRIEPDGRLGRGPAWMKRIAQGGQS